MWRRHTTVNRLSSTELSPIYPDLPQTGPPVEGEAVQPAVAPEAPAIHSPALALTCVLRV